MSELICLKTNHLCIISEDYTWSRLIVWLVEIVFFFNVNYGCPRIWFHKGDVFACASACRPQRNPILFNFSLVPNWGATRTQWNNIIYSRLVLDLVPQNRSLHTWKNDIENKIHIEHDSISRTPCVANVENSGVASPHLRPFEEYIHSSIIYSVLGLLRPCLWICSNQYPWVWLGWGYVSSGTLVWRPQHSRNAFSCFFRFLLFLSLANQSLQIETCLTTWRKTIPSFGFALSLVKSYSVKVERVSPEVFNILTSPILAAVALFERSDQGKSFQMGQEETQNRHGDYASCPGWKNNFRMQWQSYRCNKTCVFCKNRYSTVAWFGCFWVSSSLDI